MENRGQNINKLITLLVPSVAFKRKTEEGRERDCIVIVL